MVNGRTEDVEPMSRYWRGCHRNKKLQEINPTAYDERRNAHICRYNSAGGMELPRVQKEYLSVLFTA